MEIKDAFPWFWEMKALVKSRPNLVLAGIGNNDADVDLAVLGALSDSEDDSDLDGAVKGDINGFTSDLDEDADPGTTTDPGAEGNTSDGDEKELGLDGDERLRAALKRKGVRGDESDEEADAVPIPIKRTSKSKKTAARPGTSTPASATNAKPTATPGANPPTKKMKLVDQFSDIAAAEERTRQMQLETQKARTEFEVLKLKVKLASKKQKMEANLALRKLEMEQAHERRMMKMKLRAAQNPQPAPQWVPPTPTASSSGTSGPSHSTHMQPSAEHFSSSPSSFPSSPSPAPFNPVPETPANFSVGPMPVTDPSMDFNVDVNHDLFAPVPHFDGHM